MDEEGADGAEGRGATAAEFDRVLSFKRGFGCMTRCPSFGDWRLPREVLGAGVEDEGAPMNGAVAFVVEDVGAEAGLMVGDVIITGERSEEGGTSAWDTDVAGRGSSEL